MTVLLAIEIELEICVSLRQTHLLTLCREIEMFVNRFADSTGQRELWV